MKEPGRGVNPRLRVASDYAWRLLILGAAAYVVYRVALRFEPVIIAMFLALVFTALLRPPTKLLDRYMPRSMAVVTAFLGSLCLLAGIASFVGVRVSDEAPNLSKEFRGGLHQVENWLAGAPFHVRPGTLANAQDKITAYLREHRGALLNQALSSAGTVVEVLAMVALAVFTSVFFTYSGDRMWQWFQRQLPEGVRPTWQRCADAAWRTFAGYTRGVILVAASNAILVGIALTVLRVPLVLPLVLLEFFFSFIPLIGSPIAMAVATLVALASRGLTTAIIVLALIVVIGQIEGHLLHPLVMSWAVRLHPVVVAVSVIAGTLAAGLIGAVLAVPLVSVAWSVIGQLRAGQPDAPDSPNTPDT